MRHPLHLYYSVSFCWVHEILIYGKATKQFMDVWHGDGIVWSARVAPFKLKNVKCVINNALCRPRPRQLDFLHPVRQKWPSGTVLLIQTSLQWCQLSLLQTCLHRRIHPSLPSPLVAVGCHMNAHLLFPATCQTLTQPTLRLAARILRGKLCI